MWAMPSPSWSPGRKTRPAPPRRRSRSTGSRCNATVGLAEAEADGASLVWPELGTNVAFDTEVGSTREDADKVFAKADRVVSLTLVNNRLVTNYLEARACIAEYDEGSGRWTITLGSQGSHDIRKTLANAILKVEPERIRVVTPDVAVGSAPRSSCTASIPSARSRPSG